MLITIITPTLNRAAMLPEAISSVLQQDYMEIEHIVIDGGSNDGTLQLLAKYSHLKVLHQPPHGPYAALNRGLAAARGDIVGFLNSDDILEPGILSGIAAAFAKNPHLGTVSGTSKIVRNGRVIACFSDPRLYKLNYWNALIGAALPNARFYRRHVLNALSGFNTKFAYVADRDLLVRLLLGAWPNLEVGVAAYIYRAHSNSLTFGNSPEHSHAIVAELLELAEHYSSPVFPSELRKTCDQLRIRCVVRQALDSIKRGFYRKGAAHLVSKHNKLSLSLALNYLATVTAERIRRNLFN